MQAFTRAFEAFIVATPAIGAAFTGGFRFGRMPEGTAYPYLVASIVAAPSESRYGGVEFSAPTIRLTGWGVGFDSLMGAMKVLTTALDESHLPAIAGAVVLNNVRKSDAVPMLTSDVDGNGNEVWRADVIYDFAIQPG